MGSITRKCRRKLGLKKVLLVTLCFCIVAYIGSTVLSTKTRHVWDTVDFDNVTDGVCGVGCPDGQMSFYIRTGIEKTHGPIVCLLNKVILSDTKKNVKRGLNVVVVNNKNMQVITTHGYDTYLDDREFIEDMQSIVKPGYIIIVTSYDEISENLQEQSRQWFKLFGSDIIDFVSFRDSFLFIGQLGLAQGYAIEFRIPRESRVYAPHIEKIGCFSVPLGPISSIEDSIPKISSSSKDTKVDKGAYVKNCGMTETCAKGTIPVMLYTGHKDIKPPEVCLNEYMVLERQLNNAGRGMNFIIVNPKTMEPRLAKRFDTYEWPSSNMEVFMDNLYDGDIVIAIAFDDSSRKLDKIAKEKLNQLGSSMAQNIKFRDVWYFIGQKGMDGFTSMEKISFAGMENEFPKPLRGTYCLPSKIKGGSIIPDEPSRRNEVRREFCKQNDGYGDFCSPNHLDDAFIKPVPLVDDTLSKNPVYNSPIIIIPGLNQNALVKTFETTIMQPGVRLENVIVTWDEKFKEHGELASLFGFRNISISSSLTYSDQVLKSMETAAGLFPKAVYMIVIEEELILSPDFLYFLSQCTHILDRDPSLYGVSAFNYNGYMSVSTNKSTVYRVQEFPGLAFMIKKDIYQQVMRGQMKSCCNSRAWDGWSLGGHVDHQTDTWGILVPEMSRAFRQPYEGSKDDEEYLANLFSLPRNTNLDRKAEVMSLDELHSSRYSLHVQNLLKMATILEPVQIKVCVSTVGQKQIKLDTTGKVYAVYYKQNSKGNHSTLMRLSKCFGIFSMGKNKAKNLFEGILRFTYHENEVLLVGSHTKFIKYMSNSTHLFHIP